MTYVIVAMFSFSVGVVVGVVRHWQIVTDDVETAEKILRTAKLVELNRNLAKLINESKGL